MSRRKLLGFALGAVTLAGCSDATGPAGNGRTALTLSLATASTAGGSGPAFSETVSLGGKTLILDRVQLVLREIELKRARGTGACSSSSQDDSSSSRSSRSDDCEELELGPVLFDVPLDGSVDRQITVMADTGTFREVEFEIHKPEDDGEDAAFLQANPDFRRVSIRVEGTFEGTPFTFLSDMNVDVELALSPALVIQDGVVVDLTLVVDLAKWFTNGTGASLVDPATANKGGPAENLVKDNIKRSFRMIEEDR